MTNSRGAARLQYHIACICLLPLFLSWDVAAAVITTDGFSSGANLPSSTRPLGENVRLVEHDFSPLSVKPVNFRSGLFDGTYVWMIPSKMAGVLRIDPSTGTNSVFNTWPGGFTVSGVNKFYGGVFDGTKIWLIPYNTPGVVSITASTGAMTGSNAWPATTAELSIGSNAFACAALANNGLVFIMPWDADRIITVNTADGTMGAVLSSHADVNLGTGDGPFRAVLADGAYLWMIPTTSSNTKVARLDPATNAMTVYSSWPGTIVTSENKKFHGGTFDGSFLWFVPFNAPSVVRFDPSTGNMDAYSAFPTDVPVGSNSFNGGCYDGDALWLMPRNAVGIVRLSTGDGTMRSYTNFPTGTVLGDQAFYGCVADGNSIWMPNAKSPVLVRIMPITATATPTRSLSMSRVRNGTATGDGYSSGAPLGPDAKPLGENVNIQEVDTSFLPGYAAGTNHFRSGVFDGTYVWLVPARQEVLLRIDSATGTHTTFASWPAGMVLANTDKFSGGVFDGARLWLVPYYQPAALGVVSVEIHAGTMSASTAWPATSTELQLGNGAFTGACFANGVVYMMPWNADRVLMVDTSDDSLAGLSSTNPDVAIAGSPQPFRGAVFDGTHIWMVAKASQHMVSLTPGSNLMAMFGNWPAAISVTNSNKFYGASLDGHFLWLVPSAVAHVVRFDVNTGAMEAYAAATPEVPFTSNWWNGGCHDGEALWLVPSNAAGLTRIAADCSAISFTEFPALAVMGSNSYIGCVPDGRSIWLVHQKSPALLRVRPVITATATSSPTVHATNSHSFSLTPGGSHTFSSESTPTKTFPRSATAVRSSSSSVVRGFSKTPTLVPLLQRTATWTQTDSRSATTSAVIPAPMYELQLSASVAGITPKGERSLRVDVKATALRPDAPAINARIDVAARSVVSVRVEAVLQWNVTCESSEAIAHGGVACLQDELATPGKNATVPYTIAAPGYFTGGLSVIAALRCDNSETVFYARMVFDLGNLVVNASDIGNVSVVNPTIEFLPAFGSNLPPQNNGSDALITPPPQRRTVKLGEGMGASITEPYMSFWLIFYTTLVYGVILVAGMGVSFYLRRQEQRRKQQNEVGGGEHAADGPGERSLDFSTVTVSRAPDATPEPLRSRWRCFAALHAWSSVALPCTLHCHAIHATTLYAGLLLSYLTVAAAIDIVEGDQNATSAFVTSCVFGSVAIALPRAITSGLFYAVRGPDVHSLVKDRARRRSLADRRKQRIAKMRKRPTVFKSPALDAGLPDIESLAAFTPEAQPLDIPLELSLSASLQPIAPQEPKAADEGDERDLFFLERSPGTMHLTHQEDNDERPLQHHGAATYDFDFSGNDSMMIPEFPVLKIEEDEEDINSETAGPAMSTSQAPEKEVPIPAGVIADGDPAEHSSSDSSVCTAGTEQYRRFSDDQVTMTPAAVQLHLEPTPTVHDLPLPIVHEYQTSEDNNTFSQYLDTHVKKSASGSHQCPSYLSASVGEYPRNDGQSASDGESVFGTSLGAAPETELHLTPCRDAVAETSFSQSMSFAPSVDVAHGTVWIFRLIGYLICCGICVISVIILLGQTGQWLPESKKHDLYLPCVGACVATHIFLGEFAVLGLVLFYRWFVSSIEVGLMDLLDERHPYEGVPLFRAPSIPGTSVGMRSL